LFEHGLSGRLWPLHGKPYPDELLSSWLMRLIRAYGADSHRFCAHVWPGRPVWSRDIDQGRDAAILRVLTAKTATHPTRVLCTTLRGYPGYPKAHGRVVRQPLWVLHGGWGTRQRQQPWLQYCPHCLQEDADPYFRRWWRLAFVTICPAHRQQLLDRCAVCSAVVNFHCLTPEAVALTLCYHCQSDLRVGHAPALASSRASRRLLWVQMSLLVAMQRGWCYLTGDRPVRTAMYLRALHRLSRFLLTVQRTPLYRQALTPHLQDVFFAPGFPAPPRQAIEGLSVVDRLRLMLLVASWVTQWPAQVMQHWAETPHG